MKRSLAFLLALVMMFSLFLFGCAEEQNGTTEGGAPAQSQTEPTVDEFAAPAVKALNRTFRFIVRDSTTTHLDTNEVFAQGLTGDKVNDAVFSRNSVLEAQYGAKIEEDRRANPHTDFKDSLISGEYVADFFFTNLTQIKSLAGANLLVDLNTLSSMDLSKGWWNRNAAKMLSINGKTFFITGEGCTMDERATWVLFFNRDLIANEGLESPYTLVENGTWTHEKMYEYMQKTAKDLNDDGKYAYNLDVIGYAGEQFNNWVHVAAANVTVSDVSSDGVITIPNQPKQELLDAWSKVKNVVTSELRYMQGGGSVFRKNMVTFTGLNLGSVLLWPDSDVNFGVIPFPKVNPDQKGYYTAPSHSILSFYAIPLTVSADQSKDWEKNGFSSAAEQCAYFLEVFFYHSHTTLTPAFHDQVLKKQAVQDAESAKYLEMVLDMDYLVIDPVVLYNFGKIGFTMFYNAGAAAGAMADDLKHETLVSLYTGSVEAARTALKDFIDITNYA